MSETGKFLDGQGVKELATLVQKATSNINIDKQLSTTDWVSNDLKVPTTEAVDKRIEEVSTNEIFWTEVTWVPGEDTYEFSNTWEELYEQMNAGKVLFYKLLVPDWGDEPASGPLLFHQDMGCFYFQAWESIEEYEEMEVV